MRRAAAFMLLAVAPLLGQVAPAPTQTAPIAAARFEVIQSALAARDTFKLDRFSGAVYLLMADLDGGSVWALTKWLNKPEIGPDATVPRFQVFLGSQRVKDVFLLDSATGKTWVWAIVGGVSQLDPGIDDLAWVLMRQGMIVKAPIPPGNLLDPPPLQPKKQ